MFTYDQRVDTLSLSNPHANCLGHMQIVCVSHVARIARITHSVASNRVPQFLAPRTQQS